MAPGLSLFSVNAVIILSSDDGSRVFTKYYHAPHHSSGPSTSHFPSLLPPQNVCAKQSNISFRTEDASAPTALYSDLKSQKAFEKGLLEKTAKQTADIILYDNRIVLYKSESDVMMYVVGGVDENEIMLYNVILALRDSLHLLFKYASSLFRSLSLPHSLTLLLCPRARAPTSLPSPPLFFPEEEEEGEEKGIYKQAASPANARRQTNRQSVDKRTIIENYDLVSLAIDEIVDDGIILETDPTIIVQRVSRAPAQDVTQLKGIDLSEQGMNNLAQFGKAKLGDWLRQGL